MSSAKLLVSLSFAATLAIASTTAAADLGIPSGKYGLDKTHAYITFSYSHLGFSTPHVGFDSFDVAVDLDAKQLQKSSVNVTIDAASINTRVAEFDDHIKGEDYFDVEQFPQITFASTGIKMTGDNTARITGDLTIKGITRAVTLDATINKAGNHPFANKPTLGMSAQTKVSRTEWGLGRAVPMVGDEVTIDITVEPPKAD